MEETYQLIEGSPTLRDLDGQGAARHRARAQELVATQGRRALVDEEPR